MSYSNMMPKEAVQCGSYFKQNIYSNKLIVSSLKFHFKDKLGTKKILLMLLAMRRN